MPWGYAGGTRALKVCGRSCQPLICWTVRIKTRFRVSSWPPVILDAAVEQRRREDAKIENKANPTLSPRPDGFTRRGKSSRPRNGRFFTQILSQAEAAFSSPRGFLRWVGEQLRFLSFAHAAGLIFTAAVPFELLEIHHNSRMVRVARNMDRCRHPCPYWSDSTLLTCLVNPSLRIEASSLSSSRLPAFAVPVQLRRLGTYQFSASVPSHKCRNP